MKKHKNTSKKICVVSGSRADYCLLKQLIVELRNEKNINLNFIITGQHLSKELGFNYKLIEDEGITINHKIECLSNSDSSVGISTSTALSLMKFSEYFNDIKPDLLILLGDRYEIFAVSVAALIAKIPIAHIHGGELTQGAIDEALRHSITKMSHFHFVANKIYAKRVKQLGEDPKRVFNVGGFGVDLIKNIQLLTHPIWWTTPSNLSPGEKIAFFLKGQDESVKKEAARNCKPYSLYREKQIQMKET